MDTISFTQGVLLPQQAETLSKGKAKTPIESSKAALLSFVPH